MNRVAGAFVIAFCSHSLMASYAQGEKLHWSKKISADEAHCLTELLMAGNLADLPAQETRKLVDAARVGRTDLNGDGRKEYIYIFHDFGWCGSAGCQMLIGEKRNDGLCHLLYEGYGYDTFTVLRSRDRGYHRLYLPCEARFDGDQYQQLREECPNANVIH